MTSVKKPRQHELTTGPIADQKFTPYPNSSLAESHGTFSQQHGVMRAQWETNLYFVHATDRREREHHGDIREASGLKGDETRYNSPASEKFRWTERSSNTCVRVSRGAGAKLVAMYSNPFASKREVHTVFGVPPLNHEKRVNKDRQEFQQSIDKGD
ncbi:hypothetical protein BKA93DRAFT_747936 [Sparassis latifolia]